MSSRAAKCTLVFVFTAPLSGGEIIPAGFLVEDANGVQFATVEEWTATGGEEDWPLTAQAVVAGDAGNGIEWDEVNVQVSPLAFVASVGNIDITSNSTESINPRQPHYSLFWKHFRDDIERVTGVPTFMAWDMPANNLPTAWISITPDGKTTIDVEFDLWAKYFGFSGEIPTYEYGCTIEVRSGMGKRQQHTNQTYLDAVEALAEVMPLYVGTFSKMPPRTEMVSPFSENIDNPRSLTLTTDWGYYFNTPDIELLEDLDQEIFFDDNNNITNYISKGWKVKLLTVRKIPANFGTGGIINVK